MSHLHYIAIPVEKDKRQEEQLVYINKKKKISLLCKIQGLEIQMLFIRENALRPTNELFCKNIQDMNEIVKKTIQNQVLEEIKKEIYQILEEITKL
jgi:hypothetical protein